MKRNEKGVTMISLVIIIIVAIIIAGISFNFSRKLIKDTELKNIVTDMLLIEARSEILYDRNQFDEGISLIGTTVTPEIAEKFGIEGEEELKKWYVWDKVSEDVNKELEELNVNLRNGEYYIVNYEDGEIIYSAGYTDLDGNTVYKLSEMKKL